MLDFQVHSFETLGKMVVADSADRKRWAKFGFRRLMRTTA